MKTAPQPIDQFKFCHPNRSSSCRRHCHQIWPIDHDPNTRRTLIGPFWLVIYRTPLAATVLITYALNQGALVWPSISVNDVHLLSIQFVGRVEMETDVTSSVSSTFSFKSNTSNSQTISFNSSPLADGIDQTLIGRPSVTFNDYKTAVTFSTIR